MVIMAIVLILIPSLDQKDLTYGLLAPILELPLGGTVEDVCLDSIVITSSSDHQLVSPFLRPSHPIQVLIKALSFLPVKPGVILEVISHPLHSPTSDLPCCD